MKPGLGSFAEAARDGALGFADVVLTTD
jgi:hypothetical protein